MTTLDDAIDRLYLALRDARRPRSIDGCPCCIDSKNIEALLATPLKTISPKELAPYASSALLTVGDVGDYLYYLPRILEISAREIAWGTDIEITARAIKTTDPTSWSSTRRQSLTTFFHAVLGDVLASTMYFRIDGWLCAVARIGLDVGPFLSQIESDPAAVLQYFEANADGLKRGKLCNAFWELPNEGHEAIIRWFRSERVRKIPFDAYGYEM